MHIAGSDKMQLGKGRKNRRGENLSGCLAALLLASAIPVEVVSGSAQEIQQEDGSGNSEMLTEPEQILQEVPGAEQEENTRAVLPGVDVEVQPGLEENPAGMNAQMKIVEELLGDDAEQIQNVLAKESEDEGLPMVRQGFYNSAVVKMDGSLWMWGNNEYGQLGDGTTTNRSEPVKVMEDVKSISLAESWDLYSAAIKTDGSLWMWGNNRYGQLGDGTTTNRKKPIKILEGVKSVSLAGSLEGYFSAAIKTDGSLWTWGGNSHGQLGDGTTTNRTEPIKVLEGVKSISLNSYSSVAIKTDESFWMWGSTRYGQLEDGTITSRSEPVKVMEGVKSVSLAVYGGAVIKTDGSLWTWGDNRYGQLGDGTTTDRNELVKVMEDVKSILLKSNSVAAVKTDGNLWMWGDNGDGQLGNGTTTRQRTPIKIMDLGTSIEDNLPPPTNTYTFSLGASASARVTDSVVTIAGEIGLKSGAKKTLDQWREILSRIKWSADEEVVADVACRENFKPSAGIGGGEESMNFIVAATPANAGTTELTGTIEGISASCAVTIERDQTDDALQEAFADFEEVLYRAKLIYDQNYVNGQNPGSWLDDYVAGDTPSVVMHSAAKKEKLTYFAESWNELQAFLAAVDDPSPLLDKPLKKTELYEGIILALFEAASEKTSTVQYDIVKNTNSLLGVIKMDMKAIYDINVYENYNMSKLTDEQRERIWTVTDDYFKSNGFSGEISKYSSQLKDLVKYGAAGMKALDFIKYTLSCVAVLRMSEGYKAVLRDMYSLCPGNNPELKTALLDCVGMMESGTLGFIDIMAAKGIAVVGKEVVKAALSKFWTELKTEAIMTNPYVALLWASYKTSTLFCDTVFNTSAVAEKTVKLGALIDVRALVIGAFEKERDAFGASHTKENAEKFLATIDVAYRYLSEDCDGAKDFVSAVSKSLLSKIQSAFGVTKEKQLIEQIKSIKSNYEQAYDNLNVNWLFNLEEDYPALYGKYKNIMDAYNKKYKIACPVNVYIYDSAGAVAASVVNGVPYCADDQKFTVAVVGDEKEFWFYDDEPYTIRYEGTDNGAMDITIEEYDDNKNLTRTVKHTDVPLTEEQTYTSTDNGASSGNTYQLEQPETSEVIEPVADTADENTASYTLTIKNGYMVDGSNLGATGSFQAGEKIVIYAKIPDGSAWTGWTSDVSEDIFSEQSPEKATIVMPSHDVTISVLCNAEEKAGNAYYDISQKGVAKYLRPTKKDLQSVTIPSKVKIKGVTYKVTSVGNSAFQGCKALKTVMIGKHVKTIGQKAFYGDGKLKTITVKSTVLKKIGDEALYGIHKNAVIKVPKNKLSAYKRLFKNKGQKKTVKIKKR